MASAVSIDLQLRYFRFRMHNVDLTHYFWGTIMGMTNDSTIDNGSKIRSIYSYISDTVGLRFELEKKPKNKKDLVDVEGDDDAVLLHPPQIQGPTLLIYACNVREIVKTCRHEGFLVYVAPQEISVTTTSAAGATKVISAVVVDPNGLVVKIVQSDEIWPMGPKYRGPSQKMGYLTVNISDHERLARNVAFYEDGVSGITEQMKKGPKAKVPYYKIVDEERFVEDMTHFTWMGNGDRHNFTTICYKHKHARSNSGVVFKPNSILSPASFGESASEKGAKKNVFLGIVFYVGELSATLKQLVAIKAVSQTYEPQFIPQFPRFIYFLDSLSIAVEITDGIVAPFSSYKASDDYVVNEGDEPLRAIFRAVEEDDDEEEEKKEEDRRKKEEEQKKREEEEEREKEEVVKKEQEAAMAAAKKKVRRGKRSNK